MEQKKYIDIERLKESYALTFKKGELITITEKIDGANASFTWEDGKVVAFSRKKQLDETNTLRGFWNLTQQLDPDIIKILTIDGRYIIFGEWLVSHTVKYPNEKYNKFYIFNVWDRKHEQWLSEIESTEIQETLKQKYSDFIDLVPLFYIGSFTDWGMIKEYVGKTQMGAIPCGEGIVIKSQDRLKDIDSRNPTHLKIVSDKFSEVHHSKPQKTIDPKRIEEIKKQEELISQYVTDRRIDKMIQKLIDEGELKSDWDNYDMGIIAKTLPKLIFEDVKKEEPEIVTGCENFGKICHKLTMNYVRGLLNNK